MRWFVGLIIFILIDQLTKLAITQLNWSIFLNDQFAFSLPVPRLIMFLIYFVVLVGISFYVYKTWSRFTDIQRWAWVLVFAGGLSNIGERLVLSYVRDFIPFVGGMLNLADFYILIGLFLLLASQRQKMRFESSEKL
jgi:lipoprotein signal peptidase